jgi:hypothetical protein
MLRQFDEPDCRAIGRWITGFALTFLLVGSTTLSGRSVANDIPIDVSGYRAECGVAIQHDGPKIRVSWPISEAEIGRLVLDLRDGFPLIESLGAAVGAAGEVTPIVKAVEPITKMTVGTRQATTGRPPEMSPFNEFFDSPAQRPHIEYIGQLERKRARVTSVGRRATVAVGELKVGPFRGELWFTVYAGSPLLHVESVVHTEEDRTAYFYETGLFSPRDPSWNRLVWIDTEGVAKSEAVSASASGALTIRHRIIVAESHSGSLACFPPPHQFYFPRDYTNNLSDVYRDQHGFGIRQTATGGGSYSPWISAPPGTDQHLGVFYLLSRGKGENAIADALKYTHGDRFPELPGHVTFTSHWHMAIAVAAQAEIAKNAGRTIPDFVRMFKDMGVRVVHLAEFHGDGHPRDPGPLRLVEMKAMFEECRRLSDSQLLMLPGEEANVHLGVAPSKNPGHWLYFFPRPVFWTMTRAPGQPFEEQTTELGTIYHVGNQDDMVRLIEREHGLAWTAHARIKASSWAPDIYRNESFYRSDLWLGAAWKAMPADLSRPRLGERCLNLLDDMANWGQMKYLLGEVDVFKLDHTHELYGHMNVNYLHLKQAPRFDGDWTPVLDALRNGRFFVTTGEVLIHEFTVGGKSSGESLRLTTTSPPELRLELEWTFPLRFAEVISGDGDKVYRHRIDLPESGSFGRKTLAIKPDLNGRKWVRVEAWDVAGDGAFSQPVWLESGNPRP